MELTIFKQECQVDHRMCLTIFKYFQLKLYHTVIDDVITSVRDAFLDEGVDEQVLQEMKQVWTNKLLASKAIEVSIDPLEPQAPPTLSLNSKVTTYSAWSH